MPTFTKVARPSGTATKVTRPVSGAAARFGLARFSVARFGQVDPWQQGKVVRPSSTSTKVARPA